MHQPALEARPCQCRGEALLGEVASNAFELSYTATSDRAVAVMPPIKAVDICGQKRGTWGAGTLGAVTFHVVHGAYFATVWRRNLHAVIGRVR